MSMNDPITVDSTPTPTARDQLTTLVQSVVGLLGVVGVSVPPIFTSAPAVQQIVSVLMIVAPLAWAAWQRLVTKPKEVHAAAVASARLTAKSGTMRAVRPLRAILAIAVVGGLVSGCATSTTSAIDRFLASSVASEAVAYVTALDPEIDAVLGRIDAGVAEASPRALAVGCGSLNMLTLTFATAAAFEPALIDPAMVAKAQAANASLQAGVCAHPPTNLASAIGTVYAQFKALRAVLRANGATVGT